MASRPVLDWGSPARTGGAVLALVLMAFPACGSGTEGDSDETSEPRASPEPNPAEVRAQRPVANQPEPEASDAADEPSVAAAPAPDSAPEQSPAAPGAGTPDGMSPPADAAFAACTRSEGSYGTNCDFVYVSMTQAAPPRCVQLTIDNCGDAYSRQGLPVDTPLGWQLSSASIGSSPDACELGVFYPASDVVVSASGEIGWDAAQTTDLPTAIVIDVTLQPSSSADDTTSVELAMSEPFDPVRCAD